ncbi:MAG: thioesterase family protein [Burkholderiaceae bacterium]|nr:thioesterase family protein [Burkholderiaceae bacterium]
MNERVCVVGRGAVNPWDCDQWGHMNVQFYLAKASDAQAHLAARIALAPSRLRALGCSLRPFADRVLFRRELRAGDIYVVNGGIRAVGADGTLDIASRMINQDTGVEAAAFETRLRLVDAGGHATPWPAEVREAALALAGDLPGIAPPAPMAVASPAPGDAGGLLLTCRSSVEAWECDADGVAPPRAHIARFNDAITHLFRAMKIDRGALKAGGTGSAALDYDITYHRPVRAGHAIDVRSGVLAVGEKVFHVVHHIVDAADAKPLTTIVVAALFFDLKARKSIAIPAAIRAQAEHLVAHG